MNRLDTIRSQIIRLQAVIRGFLVRQRKNKIVGSIVIIQRWWRKTLEKQKVLTEGTNSKICQKEKSVCDSISYLKGEVKKIIK